MQSKKAGLFISLFGLLALCLSPAQAAMETTTNAMGGADRAQLTTMLEREEVQQQLIEMGVDPADALARVDQMTDEEVAQMNEQIAELPAGAGRISTVELLLIIILILILV